MNSIAPTRRHVLLATLSAAGGLAVAVAVPKAGAALPVHATVWDSDLSADALEVSPWVVIEPDNAVLIRVLNGAAKPGVLSHDTS